MFIFPAADFDLNPTIKVALNSETYAIWFIFSTNYYVAENLIHTFLSNNQLFIMFLSPNHVNYENHIIRVLYYICRYNCMIWSFLKYSYNSLNTILTNFK